MGEKLTHESKRDGGEESFLISHGNTVNFVLHVLNETFKLKEMYI